MTYANTSPPPVGRSLIDRLGRSAFRSRFKVGPVERRYVVARGLGSVQKRVGRI